MSRQIRYRFFLCHDDAVWTPCNNVLPPVSCCLRFSEREKLDVPERLPLRFVAQKARSQVLDGLYVVASYDGDMECPFFVHVEIISDNGLALQDGVRYNINLFSPEHKHAINVYDIIYAMKTTSIASHSACLQCA